MPTRREVRDFHRQVQSMHCPECKRSTWWTYAEIMAADRFFCDQCGKLLPFDKGAWHRKHSKRPPKSLDEQINERGRTEARHKANFRPKTHG